MAAAAAASSTPENSQDRSVHIIYVDRPESEDPEPFHVRTLASVLGSEEAAKDAIIYHYTHAASGFSAKLTAEQAEQLEKKEEVLQVMQDKILHVHSGQKPAGGMGTMRM